MIASQYRRQADGRNHVRRLLVAALFLVGLTPEIFGSAIPLTIDDVRQRTMESNRTYLAAREEITRAQSEIIKARAGAFPTLDATGSYSQNFIIPSFFIQSEDETVEFKTGFKNSFGASINLRQPLWQGGKVFTALSIAKLYKQYSLQQAEATRTTVVYDAEILFYSAVLRKSSLMVLQKAFEAADHNAGVIRKLHSQGMVSEYEVLRADVERANLLPAIIRAESEVHLSEKRLKSFLGIDLNDRVTLIEQQDDTSLAGLPILDNLLDTALLTNPKLLQADLMTEIRRKAIRVARGGYYPSLDAVANYSWQSASDDFTLKDHTSESWTAGVTVSIPIFSGGYTHGEVKQRSSEYHQAELKSAQRRDDIRLEVEEAFDQLRQAKEALDIQATTIAQAEEGLRIADLRYETGVGTLLEVLSAQAALTKARDTRAEALFFFRQARSRLKKVTTFDLN